MYKLSFVIADGARARFLRVRDLPEVHPPSSELVESLDLVNPVHRLPDRDIYVETKPGAHSRLRPGHAPSPAQAHDDRRNEARQVREQRFADRVLAALDEVSLADATRTLFVVEPRFLGCLRKGMERGKWRDVAVEAKNLSKQSLDELRRRLIHDRHLAPSCRRSATTENAARRE